MVHDIIIAIDPGANGGIAIYGLLNGSGAIELSNMPETTADIWSFFDPIPNHLSVCAYMEKVGFHRQGNSASASAKFAGHCGELRMALYGNHISRVDVAPQTWMKMFGALPEDKTARKNAIKSAVQGLYPHLKITLKTADALGILHWALQKEGAA